ncbi:FAD-dependent oxidoreductase domain-containing protein 2-like [Ptychodera flava]|uniref:FAD-dependent oxidoreductase domain-containing protein 2-like n=1 Tax=Ptychodera flava TaxID=63121 RepID=UPI00396A5103
MKEHYEFIIVGAGPSGLQMAYQMEKDKRDYLVVDAADRAGSFFRTQPRHRTLISINKRFNPFPEFEYNMRHDWNSLLCDDPTLLFKYYSKELFPPADALVRYLEDFVTRYELNISFNTRILNIDREPNNGKFKLTAKDGRVFTCKVLIIGTGALGDKLPTDIKGVELCDTYSQHNIDQEAYAGKLVCILGRGNSAFEVADHLAGHAALIHIFGEKKIKYAWDTHFVGDLRAVNNNVLDMYQLKSLHAYQAFKIKSVSKAENGKLAVEIEDLVAHWNPPGRIRLTAYYDNVIICTGFRYVDLSLYADKIKPDTVKHGKFPALTTEWETSVPDMYFIGTPMQSIDRQAASGFIHGFRYNVRTLYHLLQEKYNKVPYPRIQVDHDLTSMANAIIERVSTAASIYQMNNFLCDILVVPDDKKSKAEYLNDLPKQQVIDSDRLKKEKHVFLVVLQYGFSRFGDIGNHPNDFVHIPDFERPYCGPFLHPTVYYYQYGKLVDEADLLESLLLRFDGAEFKEDNPHKQRNRVKNILNKHLKLSEETFNEQFIASPEVFKSIFTPLSPEETKLLGDGSEYDGHCKPMTIDMMGMMKEM